MRVVIEIPESLKTVMKAIVAMGGIPLIVGGAVRDVVMKELWDTNIESKDLDIEVFRVQFKDLFGILSQFGKVDLVGADFGVIKFRNEDGEFDFSIPRNDKRLGAGHKNFEISLNPYATFEEAASRRDFTMNAMMWDFFTGEVIDPFGGIDDIANRILRPVGESFAEDALRVLRGMQFAARFEMSLSEGGSMITGTTVSEFFDLPRERILEEWLKWAKRGVKPSMGLNFLLDAGWINSTATDEDFAATDRHIKSIRQQRKGWITQLVLDAARKSLTIDEIQLELNSRELFPFSHIICAKSGLFPELQRLINCQQSKEHHPEGSVWNHTLIGTDVMVDACQRDRISDDKRIVRTFGILCHDMGKPSTTVIEPDGKITSARHAEEGEWPTRSFMRSIGFGSDGQKSIDVTTEAVVALVTKHMVHVSGGKLSDGTIRRLSLATDIRDLAAVVESDHSSRPPKTGGMPQEMLRIVERADELKVLDAAPKPILKGQHLIDAFGWHEGKHFKPVLMAAFEAQMNGEFDNETGAIVWAGEQITNGHFSQNQEVR